MTLTRPGAAARVYSSLKMTCSVMEAPRPPCSVGQPRQVQPPSASTFSQRSGSRTRRSRRPSPLGRQLGQLPHQVLGQKGPDLVAERHVLGAVSQVHSPSRLPKGRRRT